MDKRIQLLESSRRRRRQRGVAMVEGAIIFPVMSCFLVYLELAHHSFDAYLTTEHVAEQRNWSGVTVGSMIGNCPKGRDDTSYTASYFKMDAAGSGSDDASANGGSTDTTGGNGTAGQAAGKIGTQGPSGWFLHQDTAAAQVTVKRGGLSFAHKPNARSKVFCNQPWVGSIWDLITSL